MSGKQIETDEQYEKALAWLVETAVKLGDPLADQKANAKLQAIYDRTAELVGAYRRKCLAEISPIHKQIYQELELSTNS